jgi:hypothetical protein
MPTSCSYSCRVGTCIRKQPALFQCCYSCLGNETASIRQLTGRRRKPEHLQSARRCGLPALRGGRARCPQSSCRADHGMALLLRAPMQTGELAQNAGSSPSTLVRSVPKCARCAWTTGKPAPGLSLTRSNSRSPGPAGGLQQLQSRRELGTLSVIPLFVCSVRLRPVAMCN